MIYPNNTKSLNQDKLFNKFATINQKISKKSMKMKMFESKYYIKLI